MRGRIVRAWRQRALAPGLAAVLMAAGAQALSPPPPPVLLGAPPPPPLGSDEIVLPGFSPLQVSGITPTGLTVQLGTGRTYVWAGGFLPAQINSAGSRLAGPMSLRLRVGGASQVLSAGGVYLLESTPHHVVVRAQGEPYPNLVVVADTRIEYDGVAMVTLAITPRGSVPVQGLDQTVDVVSRPSTRMFKFAVADARNQPRAQQIDPSYSGPFQNMIGLADGDRSFWWFADNAVGWIWNGPTVTDLAPISSDTLRLTQHLIGSSYTISSPMQLQFNFLATPVREMGSAWRRQRVAAGIGPAEVGLGTIQAAWQAFAHYDFPYTSYPPGVASQIPPADLQAYLGLATNKSKMESNIAGYNIAPLPYLSLRCLTQIDPSLAMNRPAWEVSPSYVFTQTDAPWTAVFQKATLSHRAPGFSDYMVTRIAAEIDNLGMYGLYLDQAGAFDSTNPTNGAWTDSQGRTQASLDLLATREFLKRVRTVFAQKGKPGYLFVHSSNSELIPAFTFATAIVDGEQFTTWPSILQNDDYIASIPLDQVRLQFSPDQYGVRSAWLPEFSSFHAGDSSWIGSPAQLAAFRNWMTLVLLHDGEIVPVMVPYDDRHDMLQALDAFGTDQADFVGYWREDPNVQSLVANTEVSYYRRSGPAKVLLVVGNLASVNQNVTIQLDVAALGFTGRLPNVTLQPGGHPITLSAGQIRFVVGAKNYQLVQLD